MMGILYGMGMGLCGRVGYGNGHGGICFFFIVVIHVVMNGREGRLEVTGST